MSVSRTKIDLPAARETIERSQFHDGSALNLRARMSDVLHQRARRLAQRGQMVGDQAQSVRFIVFRHGGQKFGIRLDTVKQIFPRVPIVHVPGTDSAILGVANLQGRLCSIVDLRVLASLPTVETKAGYVILLQSASRSIGLWVDTLEGICEFDVNSLASVDEAVSVSFRRLAIGVTCDGVLALDAAKLIEHMIERTRARLKNR